jgi:hypothetical protein
MLANVRLERIRNLSKKRLVCFLGGKGGRGVLMPRGETKINDARTRLTRLQR